MFLYTNKVSLLPEGGTREILISNTKSAIKDKAETGRTVTRANTPGYLNCDQFRQVQHVYRVPAKTRIKEYNDQT